MVTQKIIGKRILFVAENFYPRIGGAEVIMDDMLCELSKDNSVYAAYVGKKKESPLHLLPKDRSFVFKNIPVFNKTKVRQYVVNVKLKGYLKKLMLEIKPDIVITQLEYTPITVDVAKSLRIPVVVYIHNYDHVCPFLFIGKRPEECKRNCFSCSSLPYKIQHPVSKQLIRWHEKSLKKADLVIANSNYVAGVIKKFYDLDTDVLYPILHLEKFAASKQSKREYITFINPIYTKGADVVLEIARKMPSEKFLIVAGKDPKYIAKFKELPNVTHLSWIDDMRDVYAKTKILLVPSFWVEPFGMVCLEAEANGIPVIGAANGGIPEAMGDGGIVIVDYKYADRWVSAINSLSDKRLYETYSKRGKQHAARFSTVKQMERLNELLSKAIV